MSAARTLAIARRIAIQIMRDHRTLALMLVMPVVVMTLVGLSFYEQKAVLDFAAPALVGVIVMFLVFILTGVSFLRERTQGTLERLLATPVGRWDVLLGYLVGFLVFAAVQSLLVVLSLVLVLQISYQGALWHIFLLVLVLATTSLNMGIFFSTFARNEFQVMQFIPLVIVPQVFLGGVLVPVEQMPGYLEAVSRVLPLTYAIQGLRDIMVRGQGLEGIAMELGILAGFAILMMVLAAATVRRSP
ncbi:MAG: ABC transporter permease [Dehalococcoidia bacterium]|jgi:ABC-2 type transport system permease protein|nr:ABC transporter permease [Dehalococcoidia bacterium]